MKRKTPWDELGLKPPSRQVAAAAASALDPARATAAETSLRAAATKSFRVALGGLAGDNAASGLADQVEEQLYLLHKQEAGEAYKGAARVLVANLKRNGDLRARVLSGAVAPERFVRLDAAELATQEQRERNAHILEENTKRVCLAGAGAGGILTTEYKCPRCESNTCDYVDSGRRDMGKCETWGNKDGQGTNRCVHCLSCGNKWDVDDV